MLYSEILTGDQLDKLRIETNRKESDKLLHLLIVIYDQKNLAIQFQSLGGDFASVTREKLNKWKASAEKHPIIFHERAIEHLRENLLPRKPAHWDNPDFTFIDLFAGIGGIRKGFEAVGGKCVFTSEYDANARRTYLANHYVDDSELPYFLNSEEDNPHKNKSFMDITKVTRSSDDIASGEERKQSILSHIPEHDILLAGFPCQPFSLAGVSKKNSLGRAHGFDCDTQGTLFFDVEQILIVRQPKYFVLENVKNLKSHDKGNTFATIIRALDRAGYWIADISNQHEDIEEAIKIVRKRKPEPTIIDGALFTPQHRERIVLVGVRKDVLAAKPELARLSLKDIAKPKSRYSLADILLPLNKAEQGKYTLTPNLWNYLYHYALKHQSKGNGFGFGLVNPKNEQAVTRTLSARYYKDGSEILINQNGLTDEFLESKKEFAIRKNQDREQFALEFANKWKEGNPESTEKTFNEEIKEGEKMYDDKYGRYAEEFDSLYRTPRRLMPRECARLMGFEKPEQDRNEADTDFRIVCADTSAYKQFGNSVVVPVFSGVADLLKKSL
ncbi:MULTISPECIES: DNA (cytosine-5-)-methyltransferase [Shewanella]|uniref:DNA (cytosine-5-)-methyltransferase n=2 Tax=Shewanellaceae TaxID=267890 RepID=UPI000CB3C5B2|nr:MULTISPECIES: DNA (cytosine-5-)-methyltransferase [Shewanella]NCO71597.1 DNA (cytosine-5-)-methyltransferase [Shewanella vesiculosa]NCP73452.1 DNA (cytosine-5-)-methyltransferase [Shewanella vesiculosa]NCP92495.1 DNA (cytosine-5-)-methyltransferase [Shewanella vesiculosa]NCP99430.1 DNA (cytosine-5-)-methyltransferase [Shewanella vesiculosa]NCQ44445.1 DNA (cytosine-5-)-methyltransferase [Shewanella frigidimarina]